MREVYSVSKTSQNSPKKHRIDTKKIRRGPEERRIEPKINKGVVKRTIYDLPAVEVSSREKLSSRNSHSR